MDKKQQNSASSQLKTISKLQILSAYAKSVKPAPEIATFLSSYPEIFTTDKIEPEKQTTTSIEENSDAVLAAIQAPQTKKFEKTTTKKIVVSKSPFTTSNLIPNPDAKVWQYLDEHSKIVGPFSSVEMDKKLDSRMIGNQLKIRFDETKEFVKIADLFGKVEEVPITRNPNQEKYDPSKDKKKLVDENIWEKVKPGNNTGVSKPQEQGGETQNSDGKIQRSTAKPNQTIDAKQNVSSKEEVKAHEKAHESKALPAAKDNKQPQSDKINLEEKKIQENKIEKIDDKNQKILDKKIDEKQSQTSAEKEESLETDPQASQPKQVAIDMSNEPSILQNSSIQYNEDEGQGEWKISTMGKSKKKKGKKGQEKVEETPTPIKKEPEQKIVAKQEPEVVKPVIVEEKVIEKPVEIEKQKSPEPEVLLEKEKVQVEKEQIKKTPEVIKPVDKVDNTNAKTAEKEKNAKPAKKRVLAGWGTTSDNKTETEPTQNSKPDEGDFPTLGVNQTLTSKSQSDSNKKVKENKEEAKQEVKPEVKPTIQQPKADIVKPTENKVNTPVQSSNIPKTQAKNKLKGSDWGTAVSVSAQKKEQSANPNEKYLEDFPSL